MDFIFIGKLEKWFLKGGFFGRGTK